MDGVSILIFVCFIIGVFAFARYMKILDVEFKLLHKRFDE
jgi:hypothetical protein